MDDGFSLDQRFVLESIYDLGYSLSMGTLAEVGVNYYFLAFIRPLEPSVIELIFSISQITDVCSMV